MSTIQDTQSCGTCAVWRSSQKECRFGSPQVNTATAPSPTVGLGYWPKVDATEWCWRWVDPATAATKQGV